LDRKDPLDSKDHKVYREPLDRKESRAFKAHKEFKALRVLLDRMEMFPSTN
jgi:hypothetical protein